MNQQRNDECVVLAWLALCVLFSGCSQDSSQAPSAVVQKPPVVVVTSFPLYAMATEIGGSAVVVEWPGRLSESPQSWTPSADDVRDLQAVDLILLNGAGYEPWTQNLSLPRSRTIDTTTSTVGLTGYTDQLLSIDGNVTHQHGPRGSQSMGTVAAATWLDPALAIAQLDRVELELVRIVPDDHEQISARAAVLRQRLDQLNGRLQVLQRASVGVLADHSDVAYLVSAFGGKWNTLEPFTNGLAGDFAAAIDTVQPQLLVFRENAPAAIQKLFVDSAVQAISIDVCDRVREEKSFVDRLGGNVDRLEAAIRKVSE